MDKYEYTLKLDQMKGLYEEEHYAAAAEVADTINWNKVKNVNALVKAGEIYEKLERYSESRDILLMAYDRSPIGRTIIFRLAEVAIKMKDFDSATEYYTEFVEIAPHDNLRYVLQYNMKKAQGADYSELIPILEELKEVEYSEEWAYELAYLYHKAGKADKCVDACDELILWFGEGSYVERALELKMIYQPLTKAQEEKFRRFRLEKQGITSISAEEMEKAGEYIHEAVEIPEIDINTKFNTVNLQKEIAKGMQQIINATEKTTVSHTMDNIKKIVEEIPYLQIPLEPKEEEEEDTYIETDEEIDGSLKINFQEMLGEDEDGQISMLTKEKALLERQITGQMTIQDVLHEWEKTKVAAEKALEQAQQKKLESAKARALQEAGDIMERLNDMIPKLDAGISPKEILEEKYMEGAAEQLAHEPAIQIENVAEEPANPPMDVQEMTPPLDVQKMASSPDVQKMENPMLNIQKMENSMLDIQKMENSMLDMQEAADSPLGVQETNPSQDIQNTMEEASEVQAEPVDSYPAESEAEPEIEPVMVGEMSSEPEAPEAESDKIEVMGEDQIDRPSDDLPQNSVTIPDIKTEIKTMFVPGEEKPAVETGAEAVPDFSEKPAETAADSSEKPAAAPERRSRKQKTKPLPTTKSLTSIINKLHINPLEEGSVPKEMLDYYDESKKQEIKHLTEEQKAVFSYFVPVSGMEHQLSQALESVAEHLKSGEAAYKGNLIIQGGQGCGKTVLATSMIRALQKEVNKPNNKIGKIDAATLNKKDIQMLLKKVEGGCLIIEKAGGISKQAAVTLSLLLEQERSGILVILEDTSKGIKRALAQDDGFAKKFTEKISVPIFTNDDLVAFAKAYSSELGYMIDDMAILALYNRISNIQRLDQATTLTEVKEIVDEAIDREARGGIHKFFSILTAKRYSDDDRIILQEKNFE